MVNGIPNMIDSPFEQRLSSPVLSNVCCQRYVVKGAVIVNYHRKFIIANHQSPN